ncbi:MAG: molecular chaperone HtpG, partial [Proteobacteria bacterium]|nr:molecular chaperone HtpG [Pseudomonadota bacterium]
QSMPPIKRVLELNPTHPLVTSLHAAYETRKDDASLAETTELIFGLALLAEGGEVADPARFTKLAADHLAKTLQA